MHVKCDQQSNSLSTYLSCNMVSDLYQQLLQGNNYWDHLLCEISSELLPIE